MATTKDEFLGVTIMKTKDGLFNAVAFEAGGGHSSSSRLHSTLEEAIAWVTERYGKKGLPEWLDVPKNT